MEILRDVASTVTLTIPLIDSNNRPYYKASPTIATGDFKLATLGAGGWTVTNLATAPTAISTTGLIFVTITATEATITDTSYPMIFTAHDVTGAEWDDQTALIWLKNPAVNVNKWSASTVSLSMYNMPAVSGATEDQVYALNGSGISGTSYPVGISSHPVNNLDDACVIAKARKIDRIDLGSNGGWNANSTTANSLSFSARNRRRSSFNFNAGTTLTYVSLYGLQASSASNLDVASECYFENCIINSVYLKYGVIRNSEVGAIYPIGSSLSIQDTRMHDCAFVHGEALDFSACSGAWVNITNGSGSLLIKSVDNAYKNVYIGGFFGTITVHSSCTNPERITVVGGAGVVVNQTSGTPTQAAFYPSDVFTLSTITSAMAATVSIINAKVTTISTDIAAVSSSVGTINTREALMATTLGLVATTVSLDYAADQAMSTTIGTINTNVAAMSVTIGSIDSRTTVMSTSIGSVYTLEQSMATTITAINARVTTISTDLAAASVTIGTIDTRTLAMSTTMAGLATTGAAMMITSQGVSSISDGVWDELLTGSSHNIATSAGRRLRSVGQYSILESQLTSNQSTIAINAVMLDSSASTVNGSYDPAMIALTGGTGMGQSRMIYQYDGASRIAYLDRDWKVKPDNTTEYQILADAGREEVNEGVLRAATANSVMLNANASTITNNYVQQILFLRSGTGQDQAKIITAYDGTTQIATVVDPFDIVPVAGETCYVILPTHLYELPQMRLEMDTALVSYSSDAGVASAFGVNVSSWSGVAVTTSGGLPAVSTAGLGTTGVQDVNVVSWSGSNVAYSGAPVVNTTGLASTSDITALGVTINLLDSRTTTISNTVNAMSVTVGLIDTKTSIMATTLSTVELVTSATANTVSLIARDFVEVWLDTSNGNNANTGDDPTSALRSYSVAAARFNSASIGGKIYLIGNIDDNITIPDRVELIGVETAFSPYTANINGSTSIGAPVVHLGIRSALRHVRVGRFYAGTISAVVEMNDGAVLEDCASLSSVNGWATAFVSLGNVNRPGTAIRRNWFGANLMVDHAIVSGSSNDNTCIIEDNEFNMFAKDFISLGMGSGYLKIRNNSFEGVATPSYAIRVVENSGITVVDNKSSGYGQFIIQTANPSGPLANLVMNNNTYGAGTGLTQQDVRNSMALSATAGAQFGSVDQALASISSDISGVSLSLSVVSTSIGEVYNDTETIEAIVTEGQSDSFKAFYVNINAGPGGDALSWLTATTSIQGALDLFSTISRGIVYVYGGAYAQNANVPPNVGIVGVNSVDGDWAAISGTYISAAIPVISLSAGAYVKNISIESSGSPYNRVVACGSASKVTNCRFGANNGVNILIDMLDSGFVEITGNWIVGSDNSSIGIGSSVASGPWTGPYNSVISNNTLIDINENFISLTGAGLVDVENNTFIGVPLGYSAVYVDSDAKFNITHNGYVGDGDFYTGVGATMDNIVQNNGTIGITSQEVRDAMALSTSASIMLGSIDDKIKKGGSYQPFMS